MEHIAKALAVDVDSEGRFSFGSPAIQAIIEEELSYSSDRKSDQSAYVSAAQNIVGAMSSARSIENYIYAHQHNERLVRLAKTAIAYCILSTEGESLLSQFDSRNMLQMKTVAKTWIMPFHQIMFDGVTKGDYENALQNLTLIIFNYDRCVEHFLVNAFMVYFDLSSEDAQRAVNKLPIYHPYGAVGKLRWQAGENAVSFGSSSQHAVMSASEHLKTFSEQISDTFDLDGMRKALSEAQAIIFLGFSFGAQNMELLQHQRVEPKPLNVYFSSKGLPSSAIASAKRRVSDCIKGSASPDKIETVFNISCYDLMNEYLYPLQDG